MSGLATRSRSKRRRAMVSSDANLAVKGLQLHVHDLKC